MKSIDVIQKNGHFYDINSGERIVIEDGSVLSLVLPSDEVLLSEDPENRKLHKRTDKQILNGIKQTYRNIAPRKVLNAGEVLSFSINAGVQKKSKHKHDFRIKLIDDLYFFKRKANQEEQMAQCNCVVFEEPTGHLEPFEPIYGYSLNQAYSKTYVHYFSKYGASTGNAFNEFHLSNGKRLKDLRLPKQSKYWEDDE